MSQAVADIVCVCVCILVGVCGPCVVQSFDCNKRKTASQCRPDCVIGIGPDTGEDWTLGQV